jgi:hypothetical protein
MSQQRSLPECAKLVNSPQNAFPQNSEAVRPPFGDVVLAGRLREAIRRLNRDIPEAAVKTALMQAELLCADWTNVCCASQCAQQ